MIEKKTLWAVNSRLNVIEKTAIVEGGNMLVCKTAGKGDDAYSTQEYSILKYFGTRKEAEEFAADEEKYITDMVPKVRKFIIRLDYHSSLMERLGIKREDYLGHYADTSSQHKEWYDNECDYSRMLETYIRCGMLCISGYMIPADRICEVQWYGLSDADEWEAGQWKATLTTTNGEKYETGSENDVRLVWAVLGRASGNWFVDDDIDYDKDENE